MITLSEALIWSLIGSSLFMTWLWIVERLRKEADIVDVGWAFGIGVTALVAGFLLPGDSDRRILSAVMGGLWGLRLSFYLYRSRFLSVEEDGRYETLRKEWNGLKFFIFFQLQGFLIFFFSLPFIGMAFDPRPATSSGAFMIVGVILWLTSIIGASIADGQLHRFKNTPSARGKVCNIGLWKYSRHPNYFFEWLHWLAYPLIAFGSPEQFLTWGAAPLMLFLILKVTGIPPTEARSLQSKGDAYREYQKTTSAFVLWPPRREQ